MGLLNLKNPLSKVDESNDTFHNQRHQAYKRNENKVSEEEIKKLEEEFDFSTMPERVALFGKYYILNGGNAAKAAVESAASKVISSNSQNASMVYLSASPNYNPVYADLVASGRHDFIPTSTIVDVMNTWEDPRREFYFTMLDGAYVGGENGASNDFTAYSHISDRIQLATFEGTLFDLAETEFLLAEAAARGFNVGGTAEEHYNHGIRASIEYWGGTTADADTYLAKSEVAYETAAGDWKQKIGMQAWLALYNRGFEAWTSYRRLDYPQLVAPADAVSPLPLRFTYPINEQTLNGANYESASSAIGGDAVDTKLFFDKF